MDSDGHAVVREGFVAREFPSLYPSIWAFQGGILLVPIEMGTVTDRALTQHMSTGSGVLRWPYNSFPILYMWPTSFRNPLL